MFDTTTTRTQIASSGLTAKAQARLIRFCDIIDQHADTNTASFARLAPWDQAAHVADGYLNFTDFSVGVIGRQSQYVCRHLAGDFTATGAYEDFSEGLDWNGDIGHYHGVLIRIDSAVTFAERHHKWLARDLVTI